MSEWWSISMLSYYNSPHIIGVESHLKKMLQIFSEELKRPSLGNKNITDIIIIIAYKIRINIYIYL